jgi:cytoskeletal protein RodZ
MTKFDQPELHPRGFPLWVEILLVSALILTPLLMVSLWQYWQDHQATHSNEATPANVTETGTKTELNTELKEKESSPDTKEPAKAEPDKAEPAKDDAALEESSTPAADTKAPAETQTKTDTK